MYERLSTAGQEILHSRYFRGILLIRASLEARSHAHLHLRINAARKLRVRLQVIRAATHLEEIERIVRKLFGRSSRGEWSVVSILAAQRTDLRGDDHPRIFVAEDQL